MGAGTLINLHTHTRYSDGDFAPEDIIEAAVEGGLTHIAITDHFATSKCPSLPAKALGRYIDHLEGLRDEYRGRIEVLAGVELDTALSRCDLFHLPFEEMERLDLVLVEYVNDPRKGGLPADRLEGLLRHLDMPVGLAHTDLSTVLGDRSPEEVADLLSAMGVFVELNTAVPYRVNGRRYYELSERYFEAFRGRVKVSVGSDTHHHLERVAKLEHPYSFVRRLGLGLLV